MTSTPNEKYDGPAGEAAQTAAPSYVSAASQESDLSETSERAHDLAKTIGVLTAKCATIRNAIKGAEGHRNGIPLHGRGWPLLAVALLAIVTVALEYFPATQFSQIFPADDTQRRIYTATFTIVPAVLALALGELLRRRRHPEKQAAMDLFLLVAVSIMTIAFLLIGYQLRLAYTTESGTGGLGLTPSMEALALTSIATIGVVLTVVSAYYRESLEMFRTRWKLAGYNRDLRTFESHLQANQRDLDRAQAALPDAMKVHVVVTPAPPADAQHTNGVVSPNAGENGHAGSPQQEPAGSPKVGPET